MLPFDEVLAKAFNPQEKRDYHGRWMADGLDLGTHVGPEPPDLPYQDPPPPLGSAAEQRGGFTATGLTNTALGDAVERALQEQLGMVNLHPARRQGPLDLRAGRYGFEVKACTTAAREYRAKPKSHEKKAKVREAEELGLVPGTMIVVVGEDGTAHVYWKQGIGSYRVGPSMNYAGRIRVDLPTPS